MSLFATVIAMGLAVFWIGLFAFLSIKLAQRSSHPSWSGPSVEARFSPYQTSVDAPVVPGDWAGRQAGLNGALQIEEEDLAQNRSGIVSERQKAYIQRREMIGLGVCVVLAALAALAFSNILIEGMRAGTSIFERATPAMFYLVIFGALCLFVQIGYTRSPLRWNGGGVRHAEGKVERTMERIYRKGGPRDAYYLVINGLRLAVPQTLADAVDERRGYRVYYVEGWYKELIGIEEIA